MLKQSKSQIAAVLTWAQANNQALRIVSGEGENGVVDAYSGLRTIPAIVKRLSRERCGGDRWAVVQTDDGFRG